MSETLLFTANDVAALLSMETCIAAVEAALRLQGEGKTPAPSVLGIHAEGGGFHIKAGVLPGERLYFIAKLNANFPANSARHGLPTIQGVAVLCDAAHGSPLAILDSMAITRLRTAAATVVAAKYLARRDSHVVAMLGCGVQAETHVDALKTVLPIERVCAYDLDGARAARLVETIQDDMGMEASVVGDVAMATKGADIIVTSTPSQRWILGRKHVRPGTFVAAVGADNESKQELEAELLAAGKVVVDSRAQCSTIGDLHHAIAAGVMTLDGVHAELGEVVAGRAPGRASQEEITIFDSTGIALEDAAAAIALYEKACGAGWTRTLSFAG